MDDNKYVIEILKLFLNETPNELSSILEAARKVNHEVVVKKAHKLKSSVGLLQAADLLTSLANLEVEAKIIPASNNIINLTEEVFLEYKKIEGALQQDVLKLENLEFTAINL
jgi:hypothetical protein